MLEDAVEAAVQPEPLHCSLLADLVDADEVVAGLANERRDIWILRWFDAIPLAHRIRCVALELRDTTCIGVQEGDVVGHELDRVAVTRNHHDLEALSSTLRRQGREDVVGLVVLFLDRDDAHGGERLLQQGDLPEEFGRSFASGALVLGILPRAERVARNVECHGDVRRLFVLQEQEEHRNEAVDGVGVLPVSRDKTVNREGIERTKSQRMAINNEEGTLRRSRHVSQPRPHRRQAVREDATNDDDSARRD